MIVTKVNELLQLSHECMRIASGSVCVILLHLVLIIGESNNYRSIFCKMLTCTSILTPLEIILSGWMERRIKFPDQLNVLETVFWLLPEYLHFIVWLCDLHQLSLLSLFISFTDNTISVHLDLVICGL